MNLPEIRYLVGEHLELQDAFACLRVCRAWHSSFSEFAFKSIKIRYGYGMMVHVPSTGWMQKYGRFVQELDFFSSTPLLHLVATDNLQGEQELEQHQSYRDQGIILLPYPRRLEFDSSLSREQHQDDRNQGIILLPNLRRLEFDSTASLTEMKSWLSHCPNLNTLVLVNSVRFFVSNISIREAAAAPDGSVDLFQHCPRLTRLDINNRGYNCLQTHSLADIINQWPPSLTNFRILDDGAPRPWFEALSGFLERMTVLDMYDCTMLEHWMLQRILCSCPLLIELRWRYFTVGLLFNEQDAAASSEATTITAAATTTTTLSTAERKGSGMKPWACISLQTVELFWMDWSESSLRNRAAMEHLRLLKQLKRLSIEAMSFARGGEYSRDEAWPREPCRLSVEDLTTVPEVGWMRKTWPLLEDYELKGWE